MIAYENRVAADTSTQYADRLTNPITYAGQIESEAHLERAFVHDLQNDGLVEATSRLLKNIENRPETVSDAFQYKFLQDVIEQWQPKQLEQRRTPAFAALCKHLAEVCLRMEDKESSGVYRGLSYGYQKYLQNNKPTTVAVHV